MQRFPWIAFALAIGATSSAAAQGADSPYRDAQVPVERRVMDLISRMTLEDKFWQLFMIPGDLDDPRNDYSHGIFGLQIGADSTDRSARAHATRINAIQKYFVTQTRLGIPIIPFEEALHGYGRDGGTVFPQSIGLAATWDTAMMIGVATATARETGSRGIRQVLSPVINIASDPRWGRTEETYGEDPWLSSRFAVAYVTAMEQRGIVATPKHFIANVGDGGRDSYPIDIDRRLLDEQFFPPFVAAIKEGHAQSVMSSYNSVDGVPASQNHWLLTDKLKREWQFPGFVISDAAATGGATVLHFTEATTADATRDALNAGLDVIFQSSYPQYRPYWAAFQRGMIADSVIDAAVSRVLRAKFQLGLFDHPFVNPDSAAFWNRNPLHRTLALDAARESMVLLRNNRGMLPLQHPTSVAVIGEDAATARFGGYSGRGADTVTILAALRHRLGATSVRYAAGPGRLSPEYTPVPTVALLAPGDSAGAHGLRGEYFDNNTLRGTPRLRRTDRDINFGWTLNSPGRGIPFDWYSVRWTGTLVAPHANTLRLGVEGNDGYRLYVDNRLVIDNWEKRSYGSRLVPLHMLPGSRHAIRLEYFESTGNARVKLIWDVGVAHTWRQRIASAVATAKESRAAVVVVGAEEGEFRDRSTLALPGHQNELIRAVAATGTPTVVVLVAGSAVTMSSWIDSVGAVLDAWYPGEQGGNAVADVLLGDYNPAGRLPITFPMSDGQLPLTYNHRPTGRGDDYVDGSGQPLFPFGFGLSFTTFAYSGLQIDSAMSAAGEAVMHFTVSNTGARAGDEVPQLYFRQLIASTARPVMQLAGFTRIHLAPGESRNVTFTLRGSQLRMLNQEMQWVVEPGKFRLMIGSSSRDIRLRSDITVR